MCEVKSVRSEELFPIIKELLNSGSNAKLRVTGTSMTPFLRHNRDQVELKAVSFNDIRKNDIVLALCDNGQYILHRVVKKTKENFYTIGDAQNVPEGPFRPDQLIAAASVVWRDSKAIQKSDILWRTASYLWLIAYPLRPYVFKCCRILKKILNINKRELN